MTSTASTRMWLRSDSGASSSAEGRSSPDPSSVGEDQACELDPGAPQLARVARFEHRLQIEDPGAEGVELAPPCDGEAGHAGLPRARRDLGYGFTGQALLVQLALPRHHRARGPHPA